MKTLLAAALALGLATPALAADAEEAAILAQVQRFFDGLGSQDARPWRPPCSRTPC